MRSNHVIKNIHTSNKQDFMNARSKRKPRISTGVSIDRTGYGN